MTFPFNPFHRLVIVEAVISGPTGIGTIYFALDTGATRTVIEPALMAAVGLDSSQATVFATMTTESAVVTVPSTTLGRLSALGQQRNNFPVLVHPLPATAGADGMLGLDFFRQQVLTIDFRAGQISVA
jgi:predicted aspartyl protease